MASWSEKIFVTAVDWRRFRGLTSRQHEQMCVRDFVGGGAHLRHTIDTDVDVHLLALAARGNKARVFGKNPHGADPQREHVKLCFGLQQSRLQLASGHEHILHDVVQLIQTANFLGLRALQHGDVRRHQPAAEPTKNRVVAKRDNVLDLPEDAACVAVVVVADRDVFHTAANVKYVQPWKRVVWGRASIQAEGQSFRHAIIVAPVFTSTDTIAG